MEKISALLLQRSGLSNRIVSVPGSYGCLQASKELNQLIAGIGNGDEVHIVTTGGGGDILGAIGKARLVKQIAANQGKDIENAMGDIFFHLSFP